MVNPQDITIAAAAVAVAIARAARAATDANDLDAVVIADTAVNQAVLDYSQVSAPPPPFALTPAIAVTGVVDFLSSERRTLFQTATHKLEEDLFDCDADGLYQFLKSLSARAEEFVWTEDNGFLLIPKDANDQTSDTESLIDNFNTIPIERIRLWEAVYLKNDVCPAQDYFMMYKCLMSSISKTGKDKVTIWCDQYKVSLRTAV